SRAALAVLAAFGGLAAAAPSALAQSGDAAARIAAARARLVAIETRAARVDDQNEIENLQQSFGYYFDKMLWEHVVDLFAANATLEIGSSGVYVGKDGIRRYLYSLSGGEQGPLDGVMFEHFQLQPIVTVA